MPDKKVFKRIEDLKKEDSDAEETDEIYNFKLLYQNERMKKPKIRVVKKRVYKDK